MLPAREIECFPPPTVTIETAAARLWLSLPNDRKYPLPEIKNPNLQTQGSSGGGGGDMRTTIGFMLIAMAAIFGYQYFFQKPKPEQQRPAQSQTQTAPAAPITPGQVQSPASSAHAPVATPQIAASSETDITVENEFYRIVFTNRGGQVKHAL